MAIRAERLRQGMLTRMGVVNESASALSDIGSEDGRMPVGYTSSNKAQILASEIANIEEKCDFLEQRNKWLTDKLLRNQRKFIEKTMLQSTKTVAKHCFKAWHEAMDTLRLEQQLHQQTESLDKCQHVAKELGQGLAREQEQRRRTEEVCQQLEEQLLQLANANSILQQTNRKQDLQIKALNRQLATALDGLGRTKNDALALSDSIDEIESRIRDLKKEDAALLSDIKIEPLVNRAPLGGQSGHAIEESVLKRDEAQLVMESVSSLLQQTSANSSPGARPSKSMSNAAERSNGRLLARTPSPMEGRFQAMNQIVSDLEHAPHAVSDSLWGKGDISTSPLGGRSRELLSGTSQGEAKPSPMLNSRDLLGQAGRAGTDQRPGLFGRSSASSLLRR